MGSWNTSKFSRFFLKIFQSEIFHRASLVAPMTYHFTRLTRNGREWNGRCLSAWAERSSLVNKARSADKTAARLESTSRSIGKTERPFIRKKINPQTWASRAATPFNLTHRFRKWNGLIARPFVCPSHTLVMRSNYGSISYRFRY